MLAIYIIFDKFIILMFRLLSRKVRKKKKEMTMMTMKTIEPFLAIDDMPSIFNFNFVSSFKCAYD
jgi:hypothetical protein